MTTPSATPPMNSTTAFRPSVRTATALPFTGSVPALKPARNVNPAVASTTLMGRITSRSSSRMGKVRSFM
jgi:hypothetical protein